MPAHDLGTYTKGLKIALIFLSDLVFFKLILSLSLSLSLSLTEA